MRKYIGILSLLFVLVLLSCSLNASTVDEEIDRLAGEVAKLELGFGDYVLGKSLTDKQKNIASQNPIKKSLQGTYKFVDGDFYVIAAHDNDLVLGVYQHYPESTMADIKKIVGSLMFEYGEPTATAHDKMIYWTYNKSGKIDQDAFEIAKDSGGAKSLATIKFSSSELFSGEPKEETAPISAYLMITSDPLSQLFLAQSRQ
ncbi:MAG: hypothetical protein ACR2PB_14835 [Desulfocapsaceae bacterium]